MPAASTHTVKRSAPPLQPLPSGPPASAPQSALPSSAPNDLAADDVSLFTCLSAYSDALDALPLDLTRSFSDLRELDAVLGPHITSLITRLNGLNDIVRDAQGLYAAQGITPGQRLLLLKECAEEARAYRMGGEDKIRVALNTCETIMSHTDYIDAILDNLTSHPELRQILDTERRPHVAGELSDGTPITAASANAAIMAAGGSGIFANPATEAGGRFGVGGGIGGVGLTTFNGMEVDKTAANGSTVGTSKKKAKTAAGEKDTGIATGKAASSALISSSVKSSAASGSGSAKKRKLGSGAVNNDKDDEESVTPSKKISAVRKKANAAAAAVAAAARDVTGPSSSQAGRATGRAIAAAVGPDEDQSGRATVSRGHLVSPALAHGASAARTSRAGSELNRRDEVKEDDDGLSSRAGSVATAVSGTRSRPARRGGGGVAMNASGSSLRRGHAALEDDQDGYAAAEEGFDDDDTGGGDEDLGGLPTPAASLRRGKHGLDRTTSSSSLALEPQGTTIRDFLHGDRHSSIDASTSGGGGIITSGSGGPGSIGGDEADERRYCFCNNVSYGDMIGCDDDACEREWFHLGCVGLTKPPSGTWYCGECLERRAAKAHKSKAKGGANGAAAAAAKARLARTSGNHSGAASDTASSSGGGAGGFGTGWGQSDSAGGNGRSKAAVGGSGKSLRR